MYGYESWTIYPQLILKAFVLVKACLRSRDIWNECSDAFPFQPLISPPMLNEVYCLWKIALQDACVHAKSLQLCPTLCDTIDCSPPGPSVHGILQARILEWVAISSSRGDLPNPGIELGSPALRADFFTAWTTREAPVRMKWSLIPEQHGFYRTLPHWYRKQRGKIRYHLPAAWI